MTDLDLNDFDIGQQLRAYADRRVLAATHRESADAVRITVFSCEISMRPEFRRAVKMDRAMLAMLKHQSIVPFRGYGESEGALFLATSASESFSLSDQLAAGRRFSSEDVIEIGWQICSALQLSHNLGFAHGGLSAESILLSDNLRVTVIDFGVARWLKAAATADASATSGPTLITVSALASREDIENDLLDLARLLAMLLRTCDEGYDATPGKITTFAVMERLLARIEARDLPSAVPRPLSAREFQGRLGEILIGTGDDAMSLVDQRKAPATSRRSIVVELFEPSESEPRSDEFVAKPAAFAWTKHILPIGGIIAVVIVLWLLAGRLF